MYAVAGVVETAGSVWPRLVRETAAEISVVETPAPGVASGEAEEAGWTAAAPGIEHDPDDEVFLLGEACAEAYMEADALQYRAMELLVEFHHREGWKNTGFSSTAEWLAWRIGIKAGAARERVRTALALEDLPETSEAMQNGELSFTKVRALTRVATPDTESTLLELARAGSAANLERMVRGWRTMDRKDEVTAEQVRHRTREFSAFVDDDGMVVLKGRLDPEVGAVLMRAVEAASDALFRKRDGGGNAGAGPTTAEGPDRNMPRAGGSGSPAAGSREDLRVSDPGSAEAELDQTTPAQRRADALGLMAERALAAGFSTGVTSGSRAERYQVMLHVDAETLKEDGEPGISELEDGTRVSAETSRRLACDAGVVPIAMDSKGEVVGAGRRSRTAPPAVRRALEARDRGCRFPGCGSRFTEAHHVKHWADGGESTLGNMVLLCRQHHRAVHEGRAEVWLDRTGQVAFLTPKGKVLLGAPAARPTGPRPTGQNGGARYGLHHQLPSKPRGQPRWKRDRDIPWEVEARAWEALDSG